VKVLRVLQEGTFQPVGGTRPDHVDVRVIAATNRPLREMVARREFREDLYYRLNVINIDVPPLRERMEDLPLLCEHFLQRFAERQARPAKRIAPELMAEFYASRWAGNIRELENTIERLAVLAGDAELIGPELRRLGARGMPGDEKGLARFKERGDLGSAVQALEREMIQSGLIATHWNKSKLAERLGLSRTTLIKKIKELGLEGADRRRGS
jgi:transcriptional regulator with PAS, ATPase and Fis domain